MNKLIGLCCCVAIMIVGCGKDDAPAPEADLQRFTRVNARLEAATNIYPSRQMSNPDSNVVPEFVGEDGVIELKDLDLVFRPVAMGLGPRKAADLFFSETEVTNQMYALYLAATKRFRDDTDLAGVSRLGPVSTASAHVVINDRESLWSGGIIPQGREQHPVTLLTISDAMAFCDWLSERYKRPLAFRLPTTEEWLFAAYGTDRQFPWGDEDRDCYGASTEPVKSRPGLRTPSGLYGLWGNVSEFVISDSNGYGSTVPPADRPFITQWFGASYEKGTIGKTMPRPRQDYWGYAHSTKVRSDQWGFRVVFVPAQ